SSDPYQFEWKAIAVGRSLKIPVVGFYHSHFPEAYLRGSTKFLGRRGTHRTMKLTRAYVRKLYNRFQATLVPSELLAGVLSEWGVRNVRAVRLGVNTDVFKPVPGDGKATRASLGVGRDRKLLLYVGRLARENKAAALADAIEALGMQKLQKLGSAAACRASVDYAWPRVFEQIFYIYDEVCSSYTGDGKA